MTADPSPQVVIWDVGGTLVTRPGDLEALDWFLRRAGYNRDQLRMDAVLRAVQEYYNVRLRWRTLEEEREGVTRFAARLLEGSPAAPGATAVLASAMADYYDLYRPVPGISDLLDDLKGRGVHQAVVSNWPPSLRGLLDHHGLARYFDLIVASGEEGVVKPDPELFRRALDRLGVGPEQAVYVGDDPEKDLPPTRELGMRMAHFDPQGRYPGADARDVAALRALLLETLGLAPRR